MAKQGVMAAAAEARAAVGAAVRRWCCLHMSAHVNPSFWSAQRRTAVWRPWPQRQKPPTLSKSGITSLQPRLCRRAVSERWWAGVGSYGILIMRRACRQRVRAERATSPLLLHRAALSVRRVRARRGLLPCHAAVERAAGAEPAQMPSSDCAEVQAALAFHPRLPTALRRHAPRLGGIVALLLQPPHRVVQRVAQRPADLIACGSYGSLDVARLVAARGAR